MSVVLGEKYQDAITGIEGTAISTTTYLFGCIVVGLSRLDKEGKEFTAYFDEPRLIAVEQATPKVESKATSGGPQETPPPRDVP